METFLLSNDFYNHDTPSENHFKFSLLDHLLSKSNSYENEEDNSIHPIDDIETSAWAEHVHSAALPRNPACSIYTASTENSLCANNGSFDTTGLDELFKGLGSGEPEGLKELLAKPLGPKGLRNPRRRSRGRTGKVIEKAKRIMKKIFVRFLGLKNSKKMMRQQMRRHEDSWRCTFKEFEKAVKMIGNRSLKRGFKVCGCWGGGENEEHGFVCRVVRGLWREFLDQNVEDGVWRLQGISVTMKKILIEMGILLRNNLMQVNRKAFGCEEIKKKQKKELIGLGLDLLV